VDYNIFFPECSVAALLAAAGAKDSQGQSCVPSKSGQKGEGQSGSS